MTNIIMGGFKPVCLPKVTILGQESKFFQQSVEKINIRNWIPAKADVDVRHSESRTRADEDAALGTTSPKGLPDSVVSAPNVPFGTGGLAEKKKQENLPFALIYISHNINKTFCDIIPSKLQYMGEIFFKWPDQR